MPEPTETDYMKRPYNDSRLRTSCTLWDSIKNDHFS